MDEARCCLNEVSIAWEKLHVVYNAVLLAEGLLLSWQLGRRFCATDVNNPRAMAEIQSRIPVMWGRPDNHSVGANVLFMDGHVEFIKYPHEHEKFPLTSKFLHRLEQISAGKGAN